MGSARPSRFATATSPQVIWKQPSPMRQTTAKSGRASFAAMAPGRPKPMEDQPLVMWNVFGACAVIGWRSDGCGRRHRTTGYRLQERHLADPGFVFDLYGVVADADDQVGRAQEAALHLPARALDATCGERM